MTTNQQQLWENISIVCEGPTEDKFIRGILRPYLNQYNISFKPRDIIVLDGNVSVARVVSHIDRASTRIVTTLIDYYGLKGVQDKRPDNIIQEIQAGSHKDHVIVIPYLQVHELEALWFSDIDILAGQMKANAEQQKQLCDIMRDFGDNPENINNHVTTAPSKRLEEIFNEYDKVSDGARVAKAIGIEQMREKCQGFHSWIQTIIETANKLRGISAS